jgi:hypothetical protein
MHTNTTRQKDLWLQLLKFHPTAEHLAVFDRKIKIAIKYEDYVKGLTMERLMPIWQQAKKLKGEQTAIAKNAVVDTVLKNTWEQHMDFVPTPFQVTVLERQMEKDLNLDAYLKTITVDTLIEIIREVAVGPKPKATAPAQGAQPALNLPVQEGK